MHERRQGKPSAKVRENDAEPGARIGKLTQSTRVHNFTRSRKGGTLHISIIRVSVLCGKEKEQLQN